MLMLVRKSHIFYLLGDSLQVILTLLTSAEVSRVSYNPNFMDEKTLFMKYNCNQQCLYSEIYLIYEYNNVFMNITFMNIITYLFCKISHNTVYCSYVHEVVARRLKIMQQRH